MGTQNATLVPRGFLAHERNDEGKTRWGEDADVSSRLTLARSWARNKALGNAYGFHHYNTANSIWLVPKQTN